MTLKIEEPNKGQNDHAFVLFALGFRPFFFFAAFLSILIIGLSLYQFSESLTLSNYYSPAGWHAHEMLFAYTVAVIAGFLLTAVGNWTGKKIINRWQLVLLSLVFLFGRVTPFISELPHWFIALSDLIFIPLIALIILIPIIRVKQWSNLIFIPLLLAMAAANLFVHLSVLDIVNIPVTTSHRVMMYLVVFLIVIMGGRVIPFFTEKGVNNVSTKKWILIERLSPMSILLILVSDVFYANPTVTAYLALFIATIHSIRLFGWYSNKIWQVPLVWILHLAYGWLIIGFIIQTFSILSFSGSALSYHALTVGGIGLITLGMMVRVSLGHTGRELKISNWIILSFILINVAAVIRVILPMFFQNNYPHLIQLAGGLWISAFVIFAVTYLPIWLRPRVDGEEG